MSSSQPVRVAEIGHARPRPAVVQLQVFSHAFQPIVNVETRKVESYEALVRGPGNEPALHVLELVSLANKYQFDQDSRVAAIAVAAKLGLDCNLNLNFLPQGLYDAPASISATLDAAIENNVPIEHLNLEVTGEEMIYDCAHFAGKLNEYRRLGLKITIDDFGAGYAGLNLLAELQPDQIKIDKNLVRGIDKHGPRQAIVRAVTQVCTDLGIDVIAEGINTVQEYRWFADQGIYLFQGDLFSKPGFESFPAVSFPSGN